MKKEHKSLNAIHSFLRHLISTNFKLFLPFYLSPFLSIWHPPVKVNSLRINQQFTIYGFSIDYFVGKENILRKLGTICALCQALF